MAICRIFVRADGSLYILHPNTRRLGESVSALDAESVKDIIAAPLFAAGAYLDVDQAMLPADRQQRHKWRVSAGRVVVDPTVPDAPHRRQDLLDAIDAAASVDALKAAMKRLVRGER